MSQSSSTRSALQIAVAVLLVAAGGLILWREILGRRMGPEPVVPPNLVAVDPLVKAAVERAADEVRRDRGDLDRRQHLCRVLQANGLLDAARDCWVQIVTIDEGNAKAWFLLAKTRERSGLLDQAIEDMLTALDRDPLYSPIQWQLALWQIETGRLEEALPHIESASRLDPTQDAVWFALARYHLAIGQVESAMNTIMDHKLLDGSNSVQARHLLAAAYRGMGRAQEAELLISGLEDRPATFPDPWTTEMLRQRTGYSYLAAVAARLVQTNRYEEALEVLARIEDMDPADHRIAVLQAQCYLKLGHPERAVEVLGQAIERVPDNSLLHSNLALAMLSVPDADGAQIALALVHAQESVDLTPDSSHSWLALASALLAAHEYEDSLDAYEKFFELDARDPVAMIRAGRVLIERGRLVEARELLDLVRIPYPERASIWASLAKIEALSGNRSEAEKLLDLAAAAEIQDFGNLENLRAELLPFESSE